MKRIISTKRAPGALGPYSQAVLADDFLFLSGQVGINPSTGSIDAVDVEGQVHQVLKNLSAVLEAAGMTLAHIVKTTIFLASMDDFAVVNKIYGTYFTDDPPARATIEVSKLPLGALVEIEAIAKK